MGFVFSGGNNQSNAQAVPAATGVPIQTSCYGRPVTLGYGQSRYAGNLLELENFNAVAVSNGGGGGGGGGSGGGGGCFPGYSLIDTPYGNLRLDGLKVGDPIWSYNKELGTVEYASILQIWKHDVANETHDKLLRVSYSRRKSARFSWLFSARKRRRLTDGSISPSTGHYLWGKNGAKISAEKWKLGQKLFHREFGYVYITNIERIPDVAFTYNILILPNNNFFVNGILAHNGLGGSSGKGGSTTYNYFIDLAIGITEGPITGYKDEWFSSSETTVAADGWTEFTGTYPQAPWKTEAYTGLAYLARLQYPLGSSANIPTFNFEVCAFLWATAPSTYGGGGDADASLVVEHFLTDPTDGAGFPSANLGELNSRNETYTIPTTPFQVTVSFATTYAFGLCVVSAKGALFTQVLSSPAKGQFTEVNGLYTFNSADAGISVTIRYVSLDSLAQFQASSLAQGLWISPVYDTQTQVSSMVTDICTACYVSPVWSSGALKFVPRVTTAVSGNGFSWSPPAAPLFSLTEDDLLPNTNATGTANAGSNTDPLILTRSRTSDQINDIKLEWLDRANSYAAAIVEQTDQANIDNFGRRPPSSLTLHLFCDISAATTSAQLQMKDQYIRNSYCFTLDARWSMLDPMDIVEVTDTQSSIINQWVRITEITENDDGTLSIVAEQYPSSSTATASLSLGVGAGFFPAVNSPPGSINDPIFFAMPISLANNQGLSIGVAVSGSVPATWGGTQVWLSGDGGQTYVRSSPDIRFPARMGVTTTDLPVSANPDITDVLGVDLTESAGTLISVNQDAAQNGYTLSLIRGTNGDEYIAFETAQLTATSKYNLKDFIERGLYNTLIVDHPIGSPFVRVDDAIYQIPYTADQIGKTIFVKFVSFNIYEGGIENREDVTAYPILLPSPPEPPDVQNFGGTQNGAAVAFSWQAVTYPTLSLAGYIIAYAPVGTSDWAAFTPLTEVTAGTEMTNADVPAGSWTFAIRAANLSYVPGSGSDNGLSPDMATFDLVVTNVLPVVYQDDEGPAWNSPVYHDLGNFKDVPIVTVDLGAFTGIGSGVTVVTDLGKFS